MPFNSLGFVAFFLGVYALYRASGRSVTLQNGVLLAACWAFYALWDVRFLALLILSTAINFFLGIQIEKAPDASGHRRLLLVSGIIFNLAILGIFKYAGFFIDNAVNLLHLLHFRADDITLKFILPLGISFYTFRAIGYLIEVEGGGMAACREPIQFGIYISFFPALAAGPIDRADRFIPQLAAPRRITPGFVDEGLHLIIWGYFQKVVVADNLFYIVDRVFSGYREQHGLDLVIGMLAYTGQMYWDFSGYTDVARGTSKLMGINIEQNFNLPHFSRNPSEFWTRWHMSLSSWFHDYLYMPIAMSAARIGTWAALFGLWTTMVLIGFWHGATWNQIVFGAYHGFLLVGHKLSLKHVFKAKAPPEALFSPRRLGKVALMFGAITIGLVIFRSESLAQSWVMLSQASLRPTSSTNLFGYHVLFFALPAAIVEIYRYAKQDLVPMLRWPTGGRVAFYGFLLTWILIFGSRKSAEFIYFKF